MKAFPLPFKALSLRQMTPDTRWIPLLKIFFGYTALLTLALLAAAIALGKVEEKTSFGLQYILGALTVLCGGWSQWAFAGSRREEIRDGETFSGTTQGTPSE